MESIQIHQRKSENSLDIIDSSARIIQNTWYNFQDREIYKLLLMAIRVLESVDPKLIIRRLSPKEFTLLNDKVFDLKLVFKLNGQWPPNVVYKIVIKNPSELNINKRLKGGIQSGLPPEVLNRWRSIDVEPLATFMSIEKSMQGYKRKRPVSSIKTFIPSTMHMQINSRFKIPGYFESYVQKYFEPEQEEQVSEVTPTKNYEATEIPVKPNTPLHGNYEEDLENWVESLHDNDHLI